MFAMADIMVSGRSSVEGGLASAGSCLDAALEKLERAQVEFEVSLIEYLVDRECAAAAAATGAAAQDFKVKSFEQDMVKLLEGYVARDIGNEYWGHSVADAKGKEGASAVPVGCARSPTFQSRASRGHPDRRDVQRGRADYSKFFDAPHNFEALTLEQAKLPESHDQHGLGNYLLDLGSDGGGFQTGEDGGDQESDETSSQTGSDLEETGSRLGEETVSDTGPEGATVTESDEDDKGWWRGNVLHRLRSSSLPPMSKSIAFDCEPMSAEDCSVFLDAKEDGISMLQCSPSTTTDSQALHAVDELLRQYVDGDDDCRELRVSSLHDGTDALALLISKSDAFFDAPDTFSNQVKEELSPRGRERSELLQHDEDSSSQQSEVVDDSESEALHGIAESEHRCSSSSVLSAEELIKMVSAEVSRCVNEHEVMKEMKQMALALASDQRENRNEAEVDGFPLAGDGVDLYSRGCSPALDKNTHQVEDEDGGFEQLLKLLEIPEKNKQLQLAVGVDVVEAAVDTPVKHVEESPPKSCCTSINLSLPDLDSEALEVVGKEQQSRGDHVQTSVAELKQTVAQVLEEFFARKKDGEQHASVLLDCTFGGDLISWEDHPAELIVPDQGDQAAAASPLGFLPTPLEQSSNLQQQDWCRLLPTLLEHNILQQEEDCSKMLDATAVELLEKRLEVEPLQLIQQQQQKLKTVVDIEKHVHVEQQQLSQAREEEDRLVQELLKIPLHARTESMEELRGRIDALEKAKSGLQADVEGHAAELSRLRVEVSGLQAQTESLRGTIAESELLQAKAQDDVVKKLHSKVFELVRKLEDHLAMHAEKLSSLERGMWDLRSENLTMVEKLQEQGDRSKAFEMSHRKVQDELSEARRKISELEAESQKNAEESGGRIRSLTEALESLQQVHSTHSNKLQEESSDIAEARKLLIVTSAAPADKAAAGKHVMESCIQHGVEEKQQQQQFEAAESVDGSDKEEDQPGAADQVADCAENTLKSPLPMPVADHGNQHDVIEECLELQPWRSTPETNRVQDSPADEQAPLTCVSIQQKQDLVREDATEEEADGSITKFVEEMRRRLPPERDRTDEIVEVGGGYTVEEAGSEAVQLFSRDEPMWLAELHTEQKRSNALREMKLACNMKMLELKQQKLQLHASSTQTEKQMLDLKKSSLEQRATKVLEEASAVACSQLRCIASEYFLVSLLLMNGYTAYCAWNHAPVWYDQLQTSCSASTAPSEEPQYSWYQIAAPVKDDAARVLKYYGCVVGGLGNFAFGTALALPLVFLCKRMLTCGSSSAPVALFLAGGCGIGVLGREVVRRTGGEGDRWWTAWVLLCVTHACMHVFTPFFVWLLGKSRVGRFLFHVLLAVVLPAGAGLLAFPALIPATLPWVESATSFVARALPG